MQRDADVIVVGAGVNGAAAARALARAGARTTLVERFAPGHTNGSSHGTSRIFRLAYPEPEYTALAREALRGWREVEEECGEQLIVRTGSLDAGDEAAVVDRTLTHAGIEHEALSAAETATRWPLSFEDGVPVVFQPDGGYTRADRALAALLAGAAAAGATVLTEEPVEAIAANADGVEVETAGRRLRAGAVVVAAGGWARGLLAPLGVDLDVVVTRETVVYYRTPEGVELPTLIEYPSEACDLPEGQAFYALPAPGRGLKAGLHHSGGATEAGSTALPDQVIVAATNAWVARRFPEADPDPLGAETCLYTNTPDESFEVAGHGRVVVLSACSGHGFKFAPAHGAKAAALALEAAG